MTAIIKRSNSADPADGVAFNFGDMTEKAKSYLESVEAEARKIISDAQQQATAIRAKAEQDGRSVAMIELDRLAEQKAGTQLKTLLPALSQVIDQLDKSRSVWLKNWECQVVGLAAGMAERIMRRELERQPEITLSLLREALELAAGRANIRIYLNCEDYQSLGPHAAQLVESMRMVGTVDFVSSAEITRGGCRLETQFGVIDQQFEVQLARLQEELL